MTETAPSSESPLGHAARNGSPIATGQWLRTFPGLPDQVPQARRFVAGLLSMHVSADDVALCVSELAANAVLHSRSGRPGGTFTVRVTAGPAVCVEVEDQGGPWLPPLGPDGSRGRGLAIVRTLAGDFGISGDRSGRTAWFTMSGSP